MKDKLLTICPAIVVFIALGAWPGIALCQSVTLNKYSDITLGKLTFDLSHSGRLQLGTDGVLTLTGSGLVSDYDSAAGHFQINTQDSSVVEIRCSKTAQMATPEGDTLVLDNIEMAIESGQAFGNGTNCNGTSGADEPAAVIDTQSIPDPDIFIGGEVTIPSGSLPPSDTFSTTTSGQSVVFDVVIQ